MVKNKEQVRHFYYRTWHKITKYIDFDNGECAWAQLAAGQELVPTNHKTHPLALFSPGHMARDTVPRGALADGTPGHRRLS